MSERVRRTRIPLFDRQLDLTMKAIRDGHLATGPHLDLLAEELARLFGVRYVTLTANGFSALFAALRAFGIEGRTVLTASASTCFSMVNAIRAAGLVPRFIDMEPTTMSIPLTHLADGGAAGGGLALVPDHFGVVAQSLQTGPPARGPVLEDAAQSFLSRMRQPTSADAIVLSFYPTKFVNGIDGGAVLTDDPDIHAAVKRAVSYEDQTAPDEALRFNLRLNNVNAAFLLGTLSCLPDMEAALVTSFRRIAAALLAVGLTTLNPGKDIPTRVIVRARDAEHRESLIARFNDEGVEAARELIPLCPPERVGDYPVMQQLVSTTFSLPFHPALTEAELDRMEDVIRSV